MPGHTHEGERTGLLAAQGQKAYSATDDVDGRCATLSPQPELPNAPKDPKAATALKLATLFCTFFMICEVVGGYMSHSLAILTDAAHLLTDVGAFMLSLFALHASARGATHTFSFGWHRAEVVGTLASVFTIWALVGAIVLEAVNRCASMYQCAKNAHRVDELHVHMEAHKMPRHMDPITYDDVGLLMCEEVRAPMMCLIGTLGLVVNLGCAAILSWGGGHGHSHGLQKCDGGHGHSHGGDDHGHSHGDDHGHSHGDDHGHSHAGDDHGHSHGDDHAHDDDDHGHSHGGKDHAVAMGDPAAAPPPKPSLALNAAFLHALGDSVQSVGVILAGAFIWVANNRQYGSPSNAYSWYNLADPACSLLFAIVTLYTTKGLIKELLNILMESTPEGINYGKLRSELQAIPGVVSVHDLHVWSLTANTVSLSVHLVSDKHQSALERAQQVCASWGITHTTIQVDSVKVGDENCQSTLGCHNC